MSFGGPEISLAAVNLGEAMRVFREEGKKPKPNAKDPADKAEKTLDQPREGLEAEENKF